MCNLTTCPDFPHCSIPHGYCHCGCGQMTGIIPETNRPIGRIAGQHLRFINAHHTRLQVHVPPTQEELVRRFWTKVNRVPSLIRCWTWQASVSPSGYGHFNHGRAHRFIWEAVHGPIPEGMCIMHMCDNPRCVRPSHLRLGTTQENTQDMIQKGRMALGERSGNARLTADQVRAIRAEFVPYVMTARRLAQKYNISHARVKQILAGKGWKHIA